MAETTPPADFNLKESNTSSVKERRSEVASSPRAKSLYILVVALITLTVLYFTFSGSKKTAIKDNSVKTTVVKEQKSPAELKKLAEQAVPVPNDDTPKILLPPKLPPMPKLIPPSELPHQPGSPLLPPPPSTLQPPTPLLPPSSGLQPPTSVLPPSKRNIVRGDRSTPMIVMRGTGAVPSMSNTVALDPYGKDESTPLQRTPNQAVPTYMGNTNYIVSQGKMIDAIIEPAISTDLKGVLRAVVSRDVYADTGTLVLIPKGTRVIGTYSTAIVPAQSRVEVAWTRLILPWGIDVALTSAPGTDPLGRAGIPGRVDSKFMNMLSTAFLKSSIEIAAGYIVGKLTNNGQQTTKTTPTGTTVVTTNVDTAAYQNAITGLSQDTQALIEKYRDATPSINIPQGAKIKIFVNRDIIFPKAAFDLVDNINN